MSGWLASATGGQGAALSRDLYHRAIEVMAGAHALGGFTSLTPAESFAVEYWPLELYKLSLAPAARRAAGEGRVRHRRGRRYRASDRRCAVRRRAPASSRSISTATGQKKPSRSSGHAGLAVGGDVTSEAAVRDAFDMAVGAFGGVDIVVSNAGIASSAPIDETSLSEWDRNQAILGDRLLPRVAVGLRRLARAGHRRVDRVRRLEERPRGGQERRRLLDRPRQPSSTSPDAWPRRAATTGSASTRSIPTPSCRGRGSGARPGARSAPRAYGIDPDELEEHYRQRTTLGVNVYPEDVAAGRPPLRIRRRSGKSTGNILNVDGGVAAAYPR